jgi:putative ABC transport system permease protein
MTARGSLLLRGMRWRLGLSLLTVLTATIAVGTAALGPLYLHTAGDSVLRRTVSSASIAQRGVTLPIYQGQLGSLGQLQTAERVMRRVGGRHPWYGPAITSVYAGVTLTATGKSAAVRASPFASQLFARTGVCGMLHFDQGSCDLGAGDVLVSARSARSWGWCCRSASRAAAPRCR